MKAFKILACVVALGSAACAQKPSSHYSVYIDPTMNAYDTDAMLSGLQSWEQSVNVTFDTKIGLPFTTEEHQIVLHASTKADVAKRGVEGDIGVTFRDEEQDRADIYYGLDLTNESTLHVEIRHELGHAMGLSHTGAGSLMCANKECAAENITSTDIAQYNSLR